MSGRSQAAKIHNIRRTHDDSEKRYAKNTMTTKAIVSPPAATFETTAEIIQRQGRYEDLTAEPHWVPRSKIHCELMAPMSDDKRIGYLKEIGCGDAAILMIARTIDDTVGEAAKPALRTEARRCAQEDSDIGQLLQRWPEPKHFRELSTQLGGLDEETRSVANAYAACLIYENAATALYLAIIDSLSPSVELFPYTEAMLERDRAMADGGYEDEVAEWPK